MKKKILCALLCAVFVVLLLPVTASADTGPKPSVRINFEGLGDEPCYGTLLSQTDFNGPWRVWNGIEEDALHNENEYYSNANLDYKTWKVFVDYKDSDGYYFLQAGWRIDGSKTLAWTYYPPKSFKILLYFPESNTFVVSDIYERYAFDSYFTVDMEGFDIAAVDRPEYQEPAGGEEKDIQPNQHTYTLKAERSYDYTWEIISLIARIVITILIEICIALLFGYRAKKQLLMITGVNAATQIVLNVLLNVINYNSGYLAFAMNYVRFELVVFAIEAALFYIFLSKLSDKPQKRWLTIIYALAANAASFFAGFAIAKLIPGIF